MRVYFDLIKDFPENQEGLLHIIERKKGNKVVWKKHFEDFQSKSKKNISDTRIDFLKYLKI